MQPQSVTSEQQRRQGQERQSEGARRHAAIFCVASFLTYVGTYAQSSFLESGSMALVPKRDAICGQALRQHLLEDVSERFRFSACSIAAPSAKSLSAHRITLRCQAVWPISRRERGAYGGAICDERATKKAGTMVAALGGAAACHRLPRHSVASILPICPLPVP